MTGIPKQAAPGNAPGGGPRTFARTSPSFTPVLVVLLGLAAAYFAWSTTSKAERAERFLQNRQRCEGYAQRLRDYLARESDVLRFLARWYRTGQERTEAELGGLLTDVVGNDDRYRPLRYVAWVERVPAGTLPVWQARRQLAVHDTEGEPVVDEQDHWIVTHVYPNLPSQILSGADLATDRARKMALDQAAENNTLVMSHPVTLIHPSPGGNTGVLVAVPVYSVEQVPPSPARRMEELAGAVVGVYALDELFQDALQPRQVAEAEGLPAVRIVVSEDSQVLGSSGGPVAPADPLGVADLNFGERIWTVELRPLDIERLTVDQLVERPSLLLPASVFIVMVLCAWIVWTLNRRNVVIQQQVYAQTAEMREKNLVLEHKERELHEANQRLLEMSHTDALTGILNRRAFEVQLEKERDRARRTGQSWGLLIFDVDHFKDYNDRYGHVAGDEVLRRVGGILQNEARRIDTVARYGGEEFVVLVGGADAGGLMVLGERIRARIQEAAIPHDVPPKGVVTVSAGASLSSAASGHEIRVVLETADRCLYQAKTTGRNRVVMLA